MIAHRLSMVHPSTHGLGNTAQINCSKYKKWGFEGDTVIDFLEIRIVGFREKLKCPTLTLCQKNTLTLEVL